MKKNHKKVHIGWCCSGAPGGKTGKTAFLPGFCKMERGGNRGAVLPCNRVLIWLGHARRASGAPAVIKICHVGTNCIFFLTVPSSFLFLSLIVMIVFFCPISRRNQEKRKETTSHHLGGSVGDVFNIDGELLFSDRKGERYFVLDVSK